MEQHQAKNLLENEDFKAFLKLLVAKMKEEDTVMGVRSFDELMARQIFIEKITNIIDEFFLIKQGEWYLKDDTDYDGIIKKIK